MIYCPQCGNPNFDDANYCDTCGEPLINADEYAKMRNAAEMQQLLEAQRQQREAAAYNKAYRKAQKDAKKAAKAQGAGADGARGSVPNEGQQSAATNVPNSGQVSMPAAGDPGFTIYKHGCLAQAWDDITESEGWAKRIVLLGFVNMVPILNFFVSGFAMKWARQLPLDKVEGMPTKIFQDGSFLQGFYAWLIGLIVGIVASIVSGILGLVPLVGALMGIVVYLSLVMFQQLSVMRVAIAGNLGPGFDIKTIWDSIFTNRFGKLFCATVLPGLIVGAAALFICGSVLVVFGMNSLASLVENIQYAQQMEQMAAMNPMMQMFGMYTDPWASVVSQAMGLVPLFFIIYLIAMFLGALSTVLTLRATAHYVTRYNHDWGMLAVPHRGQGAQGGQNNQGGQGGQGGQSGQGSQGGQGGNPQGPSAAPSTHTAGFADDPSTSKSGKSVLNEIASMPNIADLIDPDALT